MMHSLTAFLLATILALALVPAPQAQRQLPPKSEKTECGTVVTPEQIQAEVARRNNLARTAAPNAPNSNDPIYLPLSIHMVCDSFGVGGFISPDGLPRVMEVLNQQWQPLGIQFFIYGEVDYSIHNDDFYYLANDPAKHDALRKINVVPNTINVYFADLAALAGKSSFTKDGVQGILLDYIAMTENVGVDIWELEVFAHEMGHYFDLYHTHEDAFGIECPSGNNCQTAGDRLCDTPADPELRLRVFSNCTYNNSAATPAGCSNVPYNPLTNNLMSLALGHCRKSFTPEQINKVWQVLHTAENRKNLIEAWHLYVDPQASGSNTKCTASAPCRTLAKAVQVAQDGASIHLKPGVHPTSSLSGKKLTLLKWEGAGVAELRP